MSIKTIVLAAAIAATGSIAAADNSFNYGERLDSSSILELGAVNANANGVVEIYDFHKGVRGALLGTETVNAGANSDVRVNVGRPADRDVIAVLKIDGQTVAQKDYDIDRS